MVFGRAVAWEFVDEAVGKAGRPPGDLEALLLTPSEELPHDTGVYAVGVCVGGVRPQRRRTYRRRTRHCGPRARGRPEPIRLDSRHGRRAAEQFKQGSCGCILGEQAIRLPHQDTMRENTRI